MTLGLGVTALGGSTAWWASAPAEPPQRKTPSGDLLETVPRGGLPSFARSGGARVEAVYRYAVEHGEILEYIPCVCGCGAIGHRHNADCYVADRLPDGAITFTNHGAKWDICLNITRDVMEMQAEGKPLKAIRSAIDEKYSPIGLPTPTPQPPG
jgi:hypothetical protein